MPDGLGAVRIHNRCAHEQCREHQVPVRQDASLEFVVGERTVRESHAYRHVVQEERPHGMHCESLGVFGTIEPTYAQSENTSDMAGGLPRRTGRRNSSSRCSWNRRYSRSTSACAILNCFCANSNSFSRSSVSSASFWNDERTNAVNPGKSAVDTNVEAPYAGFMNLQVFAEFRLHGGEEHFHHGVVVAIPPAAHAAGNAVRRE